MLELSHIDLRYRATRDVLASACGGSAWRGSFGHALRRAVCVTGLPECGTCPMRASCIYVELFETMPPSGNHGMLSRYSHVPHSYIIRTPNPASLACGDEGELRMTLIGGGVRHAALAAQQLARAAQRLAEPGALEVLGTRITNTRIPPAPEYTDHSNIHLNLESPLRIRVNNLYWKHPDDFRFRAFFSALLRRVTQLCELHGQPVPAASHIRELAECAERVRITNNTLRWQDMHRYSNRQRRRIPMGGLMGTVDIEGELAPLWPWLWVGQFLHVGKATVMGLGRFQLAKGTLHQKSGAVVSVTVGTENSHDLAASG